MQDHGAKTPSRRLKVLIVEDEFLIADYLTLLFEDAGHDVVGTAASAEEALAILDSAGPVDLVSLDVKLPGGVDGVELAQVLRERGGPPFFFVTGSGDGPTRVRCQSAQPLAILQKPVSPDMLVTILHRAVSVTA